jgi:phospholipid/cholesterol/gamma-HCH transport system substrate-binding protein
VKLSPDLASVGRVLDYATNELSYNPPGPDEGYLYWLAWAMHNLNSATSTEDANGAALRGLVLVSCSSIADNPALAPLFSLLAGVSSCASAP